jgi:hypothetical protein
MALDLINQMKIFNFFPDFFSSVIADIELNFGMFKHLSAIQTKFSWFQLTYISTRIKTFGLKRFHIFSLPDFLLFPYDICDRVWQNGSWRRKITFPLFLTFLHIWMPGTQIQNSFEIYQPFKNLWPIKSLGWWQSFMPPWRSGLE